jgi:type IV pilus assembly protein PilB
VAIFEMLQMTRELGAIVSEKPNEIEIIKEAKRQKMLTLRQDGILKALKGLLSIEAVLRETEEM